jgi:hypothetical protein
MTKLFAVYLGGRAKKCNTELHDVVFATGEDITETYTQLLDAWFGAPVGLHIDSWMQLDVVDGFEVALSETRPSNGKRLFFVNLGAYAADEFAEEHKNVFLVADKPAEAKARAKALLAKKLSGPAHTDDLYDVDDCLALEEVNGLHVALTPTSRVGRLTPVNGYYVLPDAVVRAYRERV